VITDEQGHYSIDINRSESIYFRQLAYDFYTVFSDSLINEPKIYLSKHIVELSEVVISPLAAEILLAKASSNLHANLLKKTNKNYLIHLEENTTQGGEREAYALIEVNVSKTNAKSLSSNLNIEMNQLDVLKNINNSSFYFSSNKKPFWVDLFPEKIIVGKKLAKYADYFYEVEERAEDQIILRVSPRHFDKNNYSYYLCTINIQDTILTAIESQSFPESPELTLLKYRGVEWRKKNHFGRISFEKESESELYFIKEYVHGGNLTMFANPPYNLTFKATVYVVDKKQINTIPLGKKKKFKKLRNYMLFDGGFPNSPGFWKEYVNQ
jgi:hypothetical protein